MTGFSVGIDFGSTHCCVSHCPSSKSIIDEKGEIDDSLKVELSKKKKNWKGNTALEHVKSVACVVFPNAEGNRSTSAYVAFTDEEILVGDTAKQHALRHPNHVHISYTKYLASLEAMKQAEKLKEACGEILPECASSMIVSKREGDSNMFELNTNFEQRAKMNLNELNGLVLDKMKAVAESYQGKEITHCVVAVPHHYNRVQRESLKEAVLASSLPKDSTHLRFVDEPIAALLAHDFDLEELSKDESLKTIVLDIGFLSSRASLISVEKGLFNEKANIVEEVGAHSIDKILMDLCCKEFKKKFGASITDSKKALVRLREACEEAKITLSKSQKANITLESLYEGNDFSMSISRAKFEMILGSVFNKCTTQILSKLIKSEYEHSTANKRAMKKEDIDHVVLVGGSSYIPKVQEQIKGFFKGTKAKIHADHYPDETISKGAAIEASVFSSFQTLNAVEDVSLPKSSKLGSLPLSLSLENPKDGSSVVLLDRDSVCPVSRTRKFVTSVDNQTSIMVDLFEGERIFSKDNNKIASVVVYGLPERTGKVEVDITFSVDKNGYLDVSHYVNRVVGECASEGETKEFKDESSIVLINHKSKDKIDPLKLIEQAYANKEKDIQKKNALRAKIQLEVYIGQLRDSLGTFQMTEQQKTEMETLVQKSLQWVESNIEVLDTDYRGKHNEIYTNVSTIFSNK